MADTKTPVFRPPYRRRRIIWSAVLIAIGFLLFLGTRSDTAFGTYLQNIGLSSSSSRARLVADAKAHDLLDTGRLRVNEIHGLLHFVTAQPDAQLDEEAEDFDSSQPVPLHLYSAAGVNANWQEHLQTLKDQHPLVVFSKSYCPYSRRAKGLLESFNLSPSPFVVELDQRSDGVAIQAILSRLTGRKTVPNVILQGDSIGGSDDIHKMSEEGKLRTLLQEGGLEVGGGQT